MPKFQHNNFGTLFMHNKCSEIAMINCELDDMYYLSD